MEIKNFDDFVAYHFAHVEDGLRLGQRFCNLYIKEPWPSLYYCESVNTAKEMIWEWLCNHSYDESFPMVIQWS